MSFKSKIRELLELLTNEEEIDPPDESTSIFHPWRWVPFRVKHAVLICIFIAMLFILWIANYVIELF